MRRCVHTFGLAVAIGGLDAEPPGAARLVVDLEVDFQTTRQASLQLLGRGHEWSAGSVLAGPSASLISVKGSREPSAPRSVVMAVLAERDS